VELSKHLFRISGARPPAELGHQPAGGLVCEEVSVTFAGIQALTGVSLTVMRGEVVGLIGPNGAGKTTLVNAVSGYAPLSGGQVMVDGREISSLPTERRARLGMSRTFQHGRLFPGLSVRENVELGAIAVGVSARSARRRAQQVLESVGLQALSERGVDQLSHGDQQRVSVLRSMIAEPSYMLLDEPAAGLSQEDVDALSQVVADIRRSGTTGVLLIDHNVEFVLGLSDRVLALDHGEVIAEGVPAEIRRHPLVIASYLGDAGPAEAADRTGRGAEVGER